MENPDRTVQPKAHGMAMEQDRVAFIHPHLQHLHTPDTPFFVAQLTHPTQEAFQTESKAQAKLAPGPRVWCRRQELHHLKDLHATVEARALDTNAKATMLRTAIWENHTQGGLQLARMTNDMEKALNYTP